MTSSGPSWRAVSRVCSPSQRLKAAREMADRLAVVLAIERGEIDASVTETARLQGAVVALATLAG